ncbi:hypothetical protein F7D71_11425 [Prevotella copri]|uniref:Uncharacterized protein n=1 Tax=Segatella copri TaxID=165179 RepID=A0AA90UVB6_9BACT|nr:hypothetical protein [Segatella copri]MQO00290.1 hypothetical protein [Segatella copri]
MADGTISKSNSRISYRKETAGLFMQKYVKYATFTDKFILFDEKDLEKKLQFSIFAIILTR